ncbi:MFS transporter [Mycetocola reblochoni]|uniref:Permease n=1 Tax=Mycetocola reblochoni REB411 TaxID=1255698 RepID=A0A1R4IJ06_9MICO|nr:MFS transporter [Mycetocola reblochoni]SJN19902.1 Permease [Mycetocola reblochoni REB411]
MPGRIVAAWALWDWGSAAFNAVVTTFVFAVYLTSGGFGAPAHVSALLGWSLAAAGVLIALLAPVTGMRADRASRRTLWLGVNTGIVVLTMALLFVVKPEPGYLWLGLLLLAAGNVFFEFASVNYNAMLAQVSTPRTIGRVSGFGWGMGYLGGIVLLLVVYLGFIAPEVGLFGVTAEDGLNVRVAMLVAAAWFGLSAIPVLRAVRDKPRAAPVPRIGFFASYRELGRRIALLWREHRPVLGFLLASAVFRDGLAGVFTFGGVLAAGTFGFGADTVLLFAIAANVVAGISTVVVGLLDDRIGSRTVIIAALIGLVVSGLAVFLLHDAGATAFWVFGLALCMFVGPAQSASRSYLQHHMPAGREGEVYGLYATTGRAVSFLAPTAFALAVTLGGAQYWGVIGLVVVLVAGLVLLLALTPQERTATRR